MLTFAIALLYSMWKLHSGTYEDEIGSFYDASVGPVYR